MIWPNEFPTWASEGYDMSKELVYPDFVEGQDPDQDYIDENLPKMHKHMMYGAARLAALMVNIYGTDASHAATFLN